MRSDLRRGLLNNQLRVLYLSVLTLTIMSVPALCQEMFGPQTIYTDVSVTEDSPTIHAWGYTHAPVADGYPYPVNHSYISTTKIVLPSGAFASSSAWGMDFTPAIADVYINVSESDIANGLEGDVDIETHHQATCSAVGTFLSKIVKSYPKFGLATTTFKYLSQTPGPNGTVICFSTAECMNTLIPKCGQYGGRHVRSAGQGCCQWFQSGYITVIYSPGGSVYCYNVGFHICVGGPGICTVL